jgi:hypothetical protein
MRPAGHVSPTASPGPSALPDAAVTITLSHQQPSEQMQLQQPSSPRRQAAKMVPTTSAAAPVQQVLMSSM